MVFYDVRVIQRRTVGGAGAQRLERNQTFARARKANRGAVIADAARYNRDRGTADGELLELVSVEIVDVRVK